MSHHSHADPKDLYRAKLRSAHEAVALIRPDDTMAAPIATGQPPAFLHALGERDDYTDLSIFTGLMIEPYPCS